jgi:hypothetical protein
MTLVHSGCREPELRQHFGESHCANLVWTDLIEYARTTQVIAWHVFGFTAVVELERTENRNPPVLAEIELSCWAAVKDLPRIGFYRVEAWGEDAFEPFMSCLALSLGRRTHARAYLDMSASEIEGFYRYMENA